MTHSRRGKVIELSRPQTPIVGHLDSLHEEARKSIAIAATQHQEELGKLLQLDLDILTWERHLSGRPEVAQLSSARRDLAFAIYAAATGAYSHAYSGLRVFLELSFAAVHFSANELARRQWVSDRRDFSWSGALDEDTGILSAAFVKEFNAGAVQDAAAYAARAAKCYRRCSQFAHGKLAATRTLPDTFTYSRSVIEDWIEFAHTAAEAVLFLLFCRYGSDLAPSEHNDLSATLEHSFSHLIVVRRALGLPIDEESRSGR